MHYYSFNIADYRKDTAHLSPVEHYIHRSLLDWLYLDEKPIPKDNQLLLRRLGVGLEDEPKLKNVLSDFWEEHENGYIQKRAMVEIEAYQNKLAKLRANGSKGGRPRKSKVSEQSKINDKPKGYQKETNTEAIVKVTNNQEPVTSNQEPVKTLVQSAPERQRLFDKLWDSVPLKESKADARKVFDKLIKKQKDPEAFVQQLCDHLGLWLQHQDAQFIPRLPKYLRQELWNNEILPDKPRERAKAETMLEQSQRLMDERDAQRTGDENAIPGEFYATPS